MQTETNTQVGCTLEVEGYTWSGYKCKRYYSVNAANPPQTLRDAKQIAGDFESLTSANVITVETVTTRKIKTKGLK